MTLDSFTKIEKPNDIVREVKRLRSELFDIDALKTNEAIADFAQKLKEKYGEAECFDHRAFHAMISSGHPSDSVKKDDFGEGEVLNFLINLKKQFLASGQQI